MIHEKIMFLMIVKAMCETKDAQDATVSHYKMQFLAKMAQN